MAINRGRFTAQHDADVTVFLIGMRINRLHRVDQWGPVMAAMPPMLRHLARRPEEGMLGYHLWLGRTTMLVSYWRDAEALMRFAADSEAPHLKPWRDFRRMAESGAVGIWHETYVVQPSQRECVYVNMPDFGLGAATSTVPVGDGLRTARQRLATDG